MVSTKPPSGMRDYLPDAVVKRRYVLGKVESVFQRYGFLPLETPTMENLSTLLGKYGDEGDQLLYRVLHRGERLSRALTQEKIDIADLAELGFRHVSIALNHRVLLRSMIEVTGIGESMEGTALVAIDKLDKIGPSGVQDELIERGIAPAAAQRLLDLTTVGQDKDNAQTLKALRAMLPLPQAQQALADLETLCHLTADAPAGPRLRLAPALARGLSYYTGPIFEVVSEDFSGSLGGGGRYDNLIGVFSGKQVPAVGFSLGLGRIFILMGGQQMVPASPIAGQVMGLS